MNYLWFHVRNCIFTSKSLIQNTRNTFSFSHIIQDPLLEFILLTLIKFSFLIWFIRVSILIDLQRFLKNIIIWVMMACWVSLKHLRTLRLFYSSFILLRISKELSIHIRSCAQASFWSKNSSIWIWCLFNVRIIHIALGDVHFLLSHFLKFCLHIHWLKSFKNLLKW